MTVNLAIPIQCGKDTCASEPGKFCGYAAARADGFNPRCHLFEKRLTDDGEPIGWLKRCQQCKEAERSMSGDSYTDENMKRDIIAFAEFLGSDSFKQLNKEAEK